MFDVFSKKNKYEQESFAHSYKHSGKGLWVNEEESFKMRLPLSNGEINYHYLYKETPNFAMLDQDYTTEKSLTITLDKEQINFDSKKAGRIHDLNKLVEAVVAYDCVKNNYNEYMLEGKSKKQLKELSTEDLEAIIQKREIILNEIKDVINEIAMGKDVKKTGQEILNQSFGEGKIEVDKLVEAQVDKMLEIKEKQTEHEKKVANFKEGVAKITGLFKVVPKAISRKLKEQGALKRKRAAERKIAKEEKQRRNEIIDELVM
ncbi:MAG: hypothetical protein HFI85_04435 [Clostridia bacterium]|jgi:hypothetical protein|nr:hypothetical protein [Clostridia bacterium]